MKQLAILIAILGMAAVVALQEWKPQGPPTEGVVFNFNEGFPTFSAESLQFMSFGYSRVLSNLLWLRFLQNTPPKKMGDNEVSWIYLDLDAISTIDPDFKPVFHQGAVFLSVITDDKKGAELLLQKGVHLYPNDWQIRAYLGYHYEFELHKTALAAEQYAWAARSPEAPPLMGLLAARLMARTSGNYASIEFLRSLRDSSTDPKVRARFDQKILDLLNGAKEQ